MNYGDLVKKIADAKKGGVDLSKDEDLAIGVMNLISLEEHFFFTGEKTGKPEHFETLREIRGLRIELLRKLIDKHEGETWCVSKHLLAATMRLFEVGTKLKAGGKEDEAKEMFTRAYKLWTIFWGLRLKLLSLPQIKEEATKERPWTLQDIVGKLVDCCDEKM